MKCFDTYPLIEIAAGNQKFVGLLNEEIIITDITLAEFYYVMLQKYDEAVADVWYKKFSQYSQNVSREVLVKAVTFRYNNKKKNLSFFDAVGYIFAKENGYLFVTGDKEFEEIEGVEFVKK